PEKDLDAEPPPGRVVFRNGTGLQPILDAGKNGLFTSVVAEGLRGKADTEGYEPDGTIMLHELIKYVEKDLPKKAAALGKNPAEQRQALRVSGYAPSLPLSRNPEAVTRAEAQLKKYQAQVAKTKLDREAAEEGDKLLSRMPKLKALQELR